jgi:hypothetical protein
MAQRKVIAWLLLLIPSVLLIGLIVFFLGSDHFTNSRHLRRIKAQLAALPLPPQTQRLANKSALGILGGNGNHCDYFVGSLFRSSLAPAAIQQHYAGRTFHNPVTSAREQFKVSILATPNDFNSRIVWLPDSMDRPEAWGVSAQDFTLGTMFLVSFFESYRANDDCRCH